MRRLIPGLLLTLGSAPLWAADPADYGRDIRPILGKHCIACHGPETRKSGLRLDGFPALLQGGDRGPAIVPGSASESTLIQAIAGGGDDVPPMPPKGKRLSPAEVALIRDWVAHGAAGPAKRDRTSPASSVGDHWAFLPISRPTVPSVRDGSWVRNPIDAFLLARLEREGIRPALVVDRSTLLRRLSLDLTGLPPSVAEVDEFLADPRPDAYERCVERLLASPRYGERWGRHWLDDAGYADSGGYESDSPRSLWKYRDWVINALNRDLPFDRFAVEQLAGDLVPEARTEQTIATGFLCTVMFDGTLGQFENARLKMAIDRVNMVGTVFLGLTLGCAQCHSHKFDPISQREYYQLFAFFNDIDDVGNDSGVPLELASAEQIARRDAIRAEAAALEKDLSTYEQSAAANVVTWEAQLDDKARAGRSLELRLALRTPPNRRNASQRKALLAAFFEQDCEHQRRRGAIKAVRAREPKFDTTRVARDLAAPRQTRVFRRGEFSQPGEPVQAAVPAALPPLPSGERANRLALAHWLVDPANPLTSRVIVNRVWQHYFGLGLVETEDNFGLSGDSPSHPELLDWLASEFIARGWSLKELHRLIVGSAAYRQSSRARRELAEIDPRNRLIARQSRLRLEAEAIRDSALLVSGLLSTKVGGPSVFPDQPDGIMAGRASRSDWVVSPGGDRYRRGMYTYFWRLTPHPFLRLFDAPDSTAACTRRIRSNTPLQALTLLNDPTFTQCAEALANRLKSEVPQGGRDRVRHAFRLCLGREPTPAEVEKIERFLGDDGKSGTAIEPGWQDGWKALARAMLNLDEFLTKE